MKETENKTLSLTVPYKGQDYQVEVEAEAVTTTWTEAHGEVMSETEVTSCELTPNNPDDLPDDREFLSRVEEQANEHFHDL